MKIRIPKITVPKLKEINVKAPEIKLPEVKSVKLETPGVVTPEIKKPAIAPVHIKKPAIAPISFKKPVIVKPKVKLTHYNFGIEIVNENMKEKKLTIAIDGFSSCGKSTVAKELARKLGYVYVDTGAMYRTVTLYCMRNGLIADDGTVDEAALRRDIEKIGISFIYDPQTSKNTTLLNGEVVEDEIRRIEVSNKVSYVSRINFVRTQMVKLQQDMGRQGGIVMDGRDIGTVVFPNADLKIFMTASPEVRAQRRFDELTAKGEKVTFDEVLENVNQRDYIDQHREVSPLRQADDAHVVDNSQMTREEQFEVILKLVEEAENSHR